MPFTPTYQNVKPTVGGSADTWGGTNNDRISEAYVDFTAAAGVINATETLAIAAMPKAGGAFTGETTIPLAGPTAQNSTGFRGTPLVTVSASKTLSASDAGTKQVFTGATPFDITIPPQASVNLVSQGFLVRNNGTVGLPVKRGAGVTLRVAGSATNKDVIVAPNGFAAFSNDGGNVWVCSGTLVA